MRVKQLWVIAVGCSLLSAPALASSSHRSDDRGKKKSESIRLKTTKRAELSVLSQSVGKQHASLLKNDRDDDYDDDRDDDRDDKKASKSHSKSRSSVAGLPPGLEKKIRGIRSHGKAVRGPTGTPTVLLPTGIPNIPPTQAAATPMPEPSALLFFGVGLVVARRAIGRTWR